MAMTIHRNSSGLISQVCSARDNKLDAIEIVRLSKQVSEEGTENLQDPSSSS
jgi:hypothetical protein